MLKHLRSVGTLLFLASMYGGVANAVPVKDVAGIENIQQNGTATGVVKDALGETVIGASVVVKGTTNGTITDFDGNFSLSGVKKGDIIQISFVGYQTQEIAWNGQPLNVVLADDTQALEEVVVVGFGTQKKVNLTGAVSTVDSKAISARPVNSVTDALQGAVAGMNFSTGSGGGALNSEKSFNIRGTGTIGAGSSVKPLVLIDGMEGDMNALNPQDIENISVLKDASASSIYGSRAAGGVVLITTKSGKEGKTSVNYNNSFRFNSPLNMPEMMDSYTWANYMNQASINSGAGVWFSESKLADIKKAQTDPTMQTMFKNSNNRWEVWDSNDILPIANTDWLSEHFGNSFSQEHTLSVTGGSEKLKYYFSGNFLGQDGIMNHADDNKQRYAITSKITADLAKWISLTYSMRFTRTDYTQPSYTNDGGLFYHNVCRYWPIVPTTDPNGHYVPESFIEELKNGGEYIDQQDIIAQQIALRITPLKGWVINAELNYRINNRNNHQDYLTTYGYNCDNEPYVTNNSNSSVYEYNYKGNYFNPNIFTEYSFSLNEDHNFKVMAGFQSEWYRERSLSGQQYGILSGLPTLNTTGSLLVRSQHPLRRFFSFLEGKSLEYVPVILCRLEHCSGSILGRFCRQSKHIEAPCILG